MLPLCILAAWHNITEAAVDTFKELTLELVSTLEKPHSYVVELKDAIVSGCGDIKDKVVKKGPKVE